MDRGEATGFGVALAGHGALLAILSLGFANAVQPPLTNKPIEVSFVDEVGLETTVTEISTEMPAQSVAPELGAPEEAAPVPEPTPAPPAPTPTPPAAQPTPKPAPQPVQKPAIKPAPAKPNVSKAQPNKQAATKAAAPAKPQPGKAGQGQAKASAASRLGSDFLKGLGRDPSPSTSQKPSGSVMSSQAAASIGAAIQRQIQPCADRQVNPGPGANQIRTKINLRLNRDGSLAARPRVVSQSGVNDENSRYAERVADLAIAAFTGCSPLRGLPADLYEVKNGWSNFTMNYKLPG